MITEKLVWYKKVFCLLIALLIIIAINYFTTSFYLMNMLITVSYTIVFSIFLPIPLKKIVSSLITIEIIVLVGTLICAFIQSNFLYGSDLGICLLFCILNILFWLLEFHVLNLVYNKKSHFVRNQIIKIIILLIFINLVPTFILCHGRIASLQYFSDFDYGLFQMFDYFNSLSMSTFGFSSILYIIFTVQLYATLWIVSSSYSDKKRDLHKASNR